MKYVSYAYVAAWIAIALCLVLFVAGFVRNPVLAERQRFERELAENAPTEIDISLERDPDFENWQRVVSSRANLWGPLVPPQKVEAPAPMLAEILAGVEPTRNKIGTGDSMKVQIRVDGKKDFYGKGDQIKGCTINEITDADVVFTLVKDGKTHGIRLQRR
ncbi:MAG: hypothetical protein HUU46_23085 [Candidatus Hydrogenedentes bacterium]|nr:hypothetical protein [Candidatus Hydrogenedentota bacterium]